MCVLCPRGGFLWLPLGKGSPQTGTGQVDGYLKVRTPDHCDPAASFPEFYQLLQWVFPEGYAKIVIPLMDCLQVNKKEGKKSSQKRVPWGLKQQTAFDSIKARLCGNLLLQRVNPDKPFVLRTDASGYYCTFPPNPEPHDPRGGVWLRL